MTGDHEFEFEPGNWIHIDGEHTGHLDIRVLSHTEDPDFWDGNWLACSIDIRAGDFTCHVGANLRTDEFERFYQEVKVLYESLTGDATFTTMETQLNLHLSGDGHGHICARGQVRDAPGTGNVLDFELQLDQTYLFGTKVQLGELLNRFPIRGSPAV